MQQVKDILCVECRKTFTDEETESVTACPACGTTGLPALLSDSLDLKITRHELRILLMWASNYAHDIEKSTSTMSAVKCVEGIAKGIRDQHPEADPLTLAEELQEVANEVKSRVESSIGTFEPKLPH